LKRLWGCFASEKKRKNHKESKENNHKERKVKNAKHTKSLCALCEKPLSTLWLKKTTTKTPKAVHLSLSPLWKIFEHFVVTKKQLHTPSPLFERFVKNLCALCGYIFP